MRTSIGLVAVLLAACGTQTTPDDDGVDGGGIVPCTYESMELAVSTLAGCGASGQVDGDREEVRFANPTNVVIADDGTVYVTDFENNRVRAIAPDGTTRSVLFGEGFTNPFGMALGRDGMLYVETDDNDRGQHSLDTGTIWRLDLSRQNGGARVVARDLGRPRGLAFLPDGRLAMADHQHHMISILDVTTGITLPLAGTPDLAGRVNDVGAAARFAQPYDLVVLDNGDLLVSELDGHGIRRVTLAGIVTDFAGTGVAGNLDGPIEVATFDGPQGLALGDDGAIYVSDIRKHYIRRIKDGHVKTIAGDGTAGFMDASEPRSARFYGLEGMDVDGTRLVVADGNIGDGSAFNRVRAIKLSSLAQ